LLTRLIAGPGLGLIAPLQGTLSARGWEGGWTFEHDGAHRALALRHAWHGPAWTTLKFFAAGPPQGKNAPLGGSKRAQARAAWGLFFGPSSGAALQLTVWRSDVSSSSWRRLRQLAARSPEQPRTRITEGQ